MSKCQGSRLTIVFLACGVVLISISAFLISSDYFNGVNDENESYENVRKGSLLSGRSQRSTNGESHTLPAYRLKKSVLPEKYFLTITPVLEAGYEDSLGEQWFAPGNVVISVTAVKAVKSITLHAKNLTIHNVTVFDREKNAVHVKNVSFHERHSFMTLHFQDYTLVPGESYEITIGFTAYISEALNGLFRSSYRNHDEGTLEWFAATHMEALHARQMFPCFDEPSYKAVIQAKIGRHKDYVALFNTESMGNDTMAGVDDWFWELFAPTVKMSTYLTALIVAKFEYAEAPGKLLPGTRVRTYAPPPFIKQNAAEYSVNVAEKALQAYGDYFKEPYPMKKFDLVAVPSFLYGAMENYGLSIFRETLLLNFQNETTEARRYIVNNVICHELGHQWFGNLVTPEWWTHLWLSEGLTKYTEYIGLNATMPEFQPWDIFISESLQLGLRLDADQKTSHSLKIDEDSWPMKSEMDWFDDIAYKKGGALVKMMQGFLTEPVLKKGLSRYLGRLKYSVATQDDLFSDCDKEAQLSHKLPDNTTLKQVMSGWTLNAGFPLLRVHIDYKASSGGSSTKLLVSQEKYFASRTQRQEASNRKHPKWFIPVSVATSRRPNFDPEPEFWIRNNETSVAMTLPANSWVILNAGTSGFYRVIYDEELSSRITDQLIEFPDKIAKFARSQLIDDYFNAAWNGYLPVERALNFTRYMKYHAETEHVVWTSFLSLLKTAFMLFKESLDDFDSFKSVLLDAQCLTNTNHYYYALIRASWSKMQRKTKVGYSKEFLDANCRRIRVFSTYSKQITSLQNEPLLSYMLPRIEKAINATGGYSAISQNSTGMPVLRHAQLLDWACSLESSDCGKYSLNLVKSWKSSGDFGVIPRDFRAVVLAAAVANEPEDESEIFNFILERYHDILEDSVPFKGPFKRQLLTALSNTRDSDKIKQLLNMAFEPGALDSGSDSMILLQSLGSNAAAAELILQYFVDNHGTIIHEFGSITPITATANAMAPYLKSLSGLFMIEQLVQSNETLFKNAFTSVISRIRANIIWYDDFGEAMLDFMDNHN